MPQGNGGVVGPANDPTTSTASGVWGLKEHAEAVNTQTWPSTTYVPGYQISRSLRFNSADSAYLSKAFAADSDATKATLSFWHKRSVLATEQQFYQGRDNTGNNNNRFFVSTFQDNIYIRGYDSSANLDLNLVTTALYRDVSSWYHILVVLDTTQATSSDRVILYINGELVTSFSSSTYPSLNQTFRVANSVNNAIGYTPGGSAYLNGYLAEYHFLDGVAASVTDFGEVNATTGVWSPIAYAGTYGTNGFYLDFSDNTSTTTLGYDAAGSNDWTLNNFSVAAGPGNDSLVDTPTPYGTDTGTGGEVRGNYCTWNDNSVTDANLIVLNGGLDISQTTGSRYSVLGSVAANSGKWYYEVYYLSLSAAAFLTPGIARTTVNPGIVGYAGPDGWGYYSANGQKYHLNVGQAYGATWGVGDTIGVAVDLDVGSLTFYKNGVTQGVAFTNLTGGFFAPLLTYVHGVAQCNFGQRPWAYAPPAGYKAWVTTHLPEPSIVEGNKFFNAVLYTGTGSSQNITGVGFKPDLVWIKERNAAADHGIYDSVRGVQNQLESNTTTDETVESTGLTAFDSDGFTVGSLAQLNTNTDTYVAWNWRKSANFGFDIVTYTGNGSARTIPHNLGVVPNMIIVKARTTASTDQGWAVYHSSNTVAPETDYLLLESTAATADLDTLWNDTPPTSSVFTVGTNALVNANNDTYVAYCFAEVPGLSAFGSYTGNGSADGPFFYTGFRPAFVMFKRTNSTSNWTIIDTVRDTYNPTQYGLYPNLSNAESGPGNMDALSNGLKIRSTATDVNASGGIYIYAAFAENPFKYSLAR